MLWVVRLTAFILEVGGIFFTLKHGHAGEYGAALLLLLFDTVVLIVFVYTHLLVEKALDGYEAKKKPRVSGPSN